MSGSKNIEFKASLNTAEMDSKIQALQQKLRTISSSTSVGDKAKSIYGEGSGMTERSQKLQESFNARNLQALRQEFDVRDRLFKSQENNLKQTDMQIEKSKKNSKEQNDLLRERVKIEERMLRLNIEQNVIADKAKSIGGKGKDFGGGEFAGVAGAGGTAAGAGESSGGAGGGFNPMSLLKGGFALWATAQVVQRATTVVGDVLRAGLTQARVESQVNQKEFEVSGRKATLTGQGLESDLYAEERAKGIKEAQGSSTGTYIKNLIPAIIRGVSNSGFAGDGDKLIQGFRTSQQNAELESEIDSIETQKEMSQENKTSINYLLQNRGAFLQSQQMSGMNDEQFMGREGFLSRSGGLFTTDQKMQAQQGIYGAGGSSEQGRNAGQALSLKREYGIQNASGILGGLSANQGNGELGSDTVVRRILAEAFSVGLDSSKFSRETEKFLSISAKFVEDSGARTTEDMVRIGEEQSNYLTGNSMKEIEASGSARSFLESSLGSGGNPYQKALELSKMRQDKGLSKLTESQRISLSNMSPDQVKAGSPEISGMMLTAGYSKEEFEKSTLGGKEYSMTQNQDQDQLRKKVIDSSKSLDVNPNNTTEMNKALSDAKNSGDTKRVEQLEQLMQDNSRFSSSYKVQNNLAGQNSFESSSKIAGALNFNQKDELDGTFIGRKAPKGPMPAQEQGIGTTLDMRDAQNQQDQLSSALSYMPKYAQSVKDISAISEQLSEALGKLYKGFGLKDMSQGAPVGQTGKIVAPSNGKK